MTKHWVLQRKLHSMSLIIHFIKFKYQACFTLFYRARRTLGRVELQLYPIFRPRYHYKVVSGQRHAPAAFYPRERPGTHCTGGWVGSRAGLEAENLAPTGIRSPVRPTRSQSLYRLSYTAHKFNFYLLLNLLTNLS